MRVIAVETDIQEALEAHVRRQFSLADNVNITVNVNNTRGPDGVTADVNISDKAPEPTVAETKPATVKRTATPAKAQTTAPAATEQVQEAETATVGDQVLETAQAAQETPVAENAAAENIDPVAEAEQAQAAEAEAAPKSTSLFANLKRPENN